MPESESGRGPSASGAEEARRRMVEHQLAARGISDPTVLGAMSTVPRERFVGPAMAAAAYDDGPLPILEGQTISQPFVVALMIEALDLKPGARVLEVGGGSGYAAAVLSRVAGQVFAIERHSSLVRFAAERLVRLGYTNVQLRHGDGSLGWHEEAPFDGILVSAGAAVVPEPLLDQLADDGRLVVPVGKTPGVQELRCYGREGETVEMLRCLGGVRFVPLV